MQKSANAILKRLMASITLYTILISVKCGVRMGKLEEV